MIGREGKIIKLAEQFSQQSCAGIPCVPMVELLNFFRKSSNELQFSVRIAAGKTNVKHFPYLYMLERVAIKCVHTVDTVKVERI